MNERCLMVFGIKAWGLGETRCVLALPFLCKRIYKIVSPLFEIYFSRFESKKLGKHRNPYPFSKFSLTL